MDTITGEIKKYWVHLQAGPTNKNPIQARAIIRCYDGNNFVLEANFYPGKKGIPENRYSTKYNLVYLRYPMSMFSQVLDTLRNEKPIYFRFNEPSKVGFIRTGKEPVGEGEIEELDGTMA